MSRTHEQSSWADGPIYQIYPQTFNEDNERTPQGVGSLDGIAERIDYLEQLGIGAVWLSPFYRSPMKDGGYDVTDMCDVDPHFGTLEDFDELVQALHEKDIKVMIDFVANHTSDEHPWFHDSRQRANNKDDWYIWADGQIDPATGERQPPNNWASVFSLPELERRKHGEMPELADGDLTPPRSAWTWHEDRGQYYLHSFAPFQPDLNWNNPDVREAMKSVMRFWLDRGVDGFRIDAINYIGKDIAYTPDGQLHAPDEEHNTSYEEGVDNPYDQLVRLRSCGYPGTFYPYVAELVSVLREPQYFARQPRAILEAYMQDHELHQLDEIDPVVASSFNFTPIDEPWGMSTVVRKAQLDAYHTRVAATKNIANTVMGNHDKSRVVSRFGRDQAKALLLYNLFQGGDMVIYNGEELGREDHDALPPQMIRDPNGLRDPERTPMPWREQADNRDFSKAPAEDLYLPIQPQDIPVDVQQADATSFLSFYQRAIELRKKHGRDAYLPLDVVTDRGKNDGVLAYGLGDHVTVLTNFTAEARHIHSLPPERAVGQVALSSYLMEAGGNFEQQNAYELRPNESLVIEHPSE